MNLQDACRFLETLRGVSVLAAPEQDRLERFCQRVRFHRIQRHLFPEELTGLMNTVSEGELVSLMDELQVRLLLGRACGEAFVYGPYRCEELSTLNARMLLGRCGLSASHATGLLAYRSRFPVISQRQATRDCRAIITTISGSELLPPMREYNFLHPSVSQSDGIEQPFADIVDERYAIEREMMQAVRSGNATQAIKNWHQLHMRMDYYKRELGNTLQTAGHSASITRTVLRLSAMDAGVPPVVLDDLTGKAAKNNREARTLDEIENNTEVLIRELCRAVRSIHRHETDYLTEAVRHHIESHYGEELTVAELAIKFDMPESRLIQRFRSQTGQTPGAFLRQVRLRRGAELLLGTRKPIQEIAAQVGIPDANYFTKLFKAEYGKTPAAYRNNKK